MLSLAPVCLKNGSVKERVDTEKTGSNKGKMIPTDIGVLVNKFLVNNFTDIIDYQFTAKAEKEFDSIELEGGINLFSRDHVPSFASVST